MPTLILLVSCHHIRGNLIFSSAKLFFFNFLEHLVQPPLTMSPACQPYIVHNRTIQHLNIKKTKYQSMSLRYIKRSEWFRCFYLVVSIIICLLSNKIFLLRNCSDIAEDYRWNYCTWWVSVAIYHDLFYLKYRFVLF